MGSAAGTSRFETERLLDDPAARLVSGARR